MQASRSSKTAVRRQASPRVRGLLWAAVIFASLPAGVVMAVQGSEAPSSQQAAATEVTPAASDARTAWEKVFVTLWRAFIMAWDGPDAQMTALAAAGTDQSFDAGADAADAGEPGATDSSSAEPPATDAGTPGVQDATLSEGGSRSSTALPVGGGAASSGSGGGGITSAARSGVHVVLPERIGLVFDHEHPRARTAPADLEDFVDVERTGAAGPVRIIDDMQREGRVQVPRFEMDAPLG